MAYLLVAINLLILIISGISVVLSFKFWKLTKAHGTLFLMFACIWAATFRAMMIVGIVSTSYWQLGFWLPFMLGLWYLYHSMKGFYDKTAQQKHSWFKRCFRK